MLLETEELVARPPSQPAIRSSDQRRIAALFPDVLKFAAILLQLLLLAIVIKRFNLENPAVFRVMVLALAGFVVHSFLPMAYRLPFFLALSLGAIVLILGPVETAWLLGLGIGLVAICHAPAPFWLRLPVLIGAAGVLTAMRGGWLASPVPQAVWPLLGSMFAFRMAIYLYDLYHDRRAKSLSEALSYFFMVPNVCFPLFPVVDFQAFSKRYFAGDPYDIYRTGVRWMFRGVLHLLVYRALYKSWSISLWDVENAGDFVHYCLYLFLLYLRVSGLFHLIVGTLHLFGFNLPETHHLYFLSWSFTDFWRRINIYWKDFMTRIIFYPAYFQFRPLGTKGALVASTVVVFIMTWLLHAVQWFWLRGEILFTATDILFYAILCCLVVVNSLIELKRGQKRMGGVSWSKAFVVGLSTLATFTTICILWSMWTTGSFAQWITLWDVAFLPPTLGGWLLIAGTVIGLVGTATVLAHNPDLFSWKKRSFIREAAMQSFFMVLLCGVSISAVNHRLGYAGQVIDQARDGGLNLVENAELERGYYEDLLAVEKFNGELMNLYLRRPPEWRANIMEAGLTQRTNNILQYEFKPNVESVIKGAVLKTNRWSMHDKDYAQEPPAGCYRVALLGASHVMGTGVTRDKTFEAVLEDKLNQNNGGKPNRSYEILNFAVAGYLPVRQVWVLEDKVLPFKPNAMFYVGHPGDARRTVFDLVTALEKGIELPDPYLREIAKEANVDKDTPDPRLRRRLTPYGEQLLSWTFKRLVATCRKNGIAPIFILLPEVGDPVDSSTDLRLAKDAGFTVLDLTGVYPRPYESLWIAEWDKHPNVTGHRLVGERLYELLRKTNAIPLSDSNQHERENPKSQTPANRSL
jgi:D-alanyl-lipoteichoic acid acyltransferase DltB (MBOAT superfamily)